MLILNVLVTIIGEEPEAQLKIVMDAIDSLIGREKFPQEVLEMIQTPCDDQSVTWHQKKIRFAISLTESELGFIKLGVLMAKPSLKRVCEGIALMVPKEKRNAMIDKIAEAAGLMGGISPLFIEYSYTITPTSLYNEGSDVWLHHCLSTKIESSALN